MTRRVIACGLVTDVCFCFCFCLCVLEEELRSKREGWGCRRLYIKSFLPSFLFVFPALLGMNVLCRQRHARTRVGWVGACVMGMGPHDLTTWYTVNSSDCVAHCSLALARSGGSMGNEAGVAAAHASNGACCSQRIKVSMRQPTSAPPKLPTLAQRTQGPPRGACLFGNEPDHVMHRQGQQAGWATRFGLGEKRQACPFLGLERSVCLESTTREALASVTSETGAPEGSRAIVPPEPRDLPAKTWLSLKEKTTDRLYGVSG